CCWLAAVVVVVGRNASAESPPAIGAREGRSPRGPSLRIERVEMIGKPAPAVRLELSGPAEPLTRMLPADGKTPARLYVDVPGAALGAKVQKLLAGSGPVLRVRTA